MIQHEIWKPIFIIQNKVTYDLRNMYAISNFGRVKNIITNKILAININRYGYYFINLTYTKGKRKNFKVHRLVATMFIPNTNNLPQVNHKDGNKLNNKVSNLEWCDQYENAMHARKTGLMDNLIEYVNSEKNKEFCKIIYKKGVEKLKIKVDQYTMKGEFIKTHESYMSAAREVGLKYDTSIRKCCKGLGKHAAGFIWKTHK